MIKLWTIHAWKLENKLFVEENYQQWAKSYSIKKQRFDDFAKSVQLTFHASQILIHCSFYKEPIHWGPATPVDKSYGTHVCLWPPLPNQLRQAHALGQIEPIISSFEVKSPWQAPVRWIVLCSASHTRRWRSPRMARRALPTKKDTAEIE